MHTGTLYPRRIVFAHGLARSIGFCLCLYTLFFIHYYSKAFIFYTASTIDSSLIFFSNTVRVIIALYEDRSQFIKQIVRQLPSIMYVYVHSHKSLEIFNYNKRCSQHVILVLLVHIKFSACLWNFLAHTCSLYLLNCFGKVYIYGVNLDFTVIGVPQSM